MVEGIESECILPSPCRMVSLERNRTGPFSWSNFSDTAEFMNATKSCLSAGYPTRFVRLSPQIKNPFAERDFRLLTLTLFYLGSQTC